MFGFPLAGEISASHMATHAARRVSSKTVLATRWQQCLGFSHVRHTQAGPIRLTRTPPGKTVFPCLQKDTFPEHGALRNTSQQYSTWKDFSSANSTLSLDDIRFLAMLAQKHSHQDTSERSDNTPQDIAPSLEMNPVNITTSSFTCPASNSATPAEARIAGLHTQFHSALHAMQRRDSRQLLAALNRITDLPEEDLVGAIAALPRTTFSEFLRSLDPLQIGRDNDPTHEKAIGPGIWQILNLGAVLDEWGIRTLYTKLLRQMLILMRALKAAGHVLNINDYVPLIRAAGVTSDLTVARLLWHQMRADGVDYWRNYIVYHEFLKARFLVDPSYSGFDMKRYMMTPRNLHRRGLVKLTASVSRLDRLRFHLRKRAFKFGLDRHADHALDVTRLLRKPLPPTRIFLYAQKHGVRMTDSLMCTFIVAFARAGSLRFVQHRILEDYFGVSVDKAKEDGQILIRRCSGRPTSAGSLDSLRPAKPFLRPSAKLIDAIVYAYCSNAQLPMAFNIIEFISSTFNIPLSQRVWYDLLEWAYILSTPPTSTAWKMAGWHHQVPSPNAIELIWKSMTAPPYNVQPGFKQYSILIRNRLALGKLEDSIEYMRQARRFFDAQGTKYETAAFNYAAAKFVTVNCTEETRAFQRARFLRSYMRQEMNSWCTILLEKKFRPGALHDQMATQAIPDFVSEWRDILNNPVKYQTASGYLSLLDPAEPVEKTLFVRNHVLEIPIRRQGRWYLKPLIQTQSRLLSKHGLGDLMSTRLHPLAIFKGIVPNDRPSRSRRVEMHHARRAAREQPATWNEGREHLPQALAAEQAQPHEDIWDDDD